MAGVHLDLEGEQVVLDLLGEVEQRVGNLQTPFEDIGEYLLQAHDERFEQQVSPDGNAWEALSEDYLKSERKQASRGSDKILVLDDYLKSLLRYFANAKELLFGSDRVYAATHQLGDESRGIPARPFLGISQDDENEIVWILEDWLLPN